MRYAINDKKRVILVNFAHNTPEETKSAALEFSLLAKFVGVIPVATSLCRRLTPDSSDALRAATGWHWTTWSW
jgi:hypothetical protein